MSKLSKKNSNANTLRWQDTILEGARPLPLAPGQGAQVCADLLALEAEIELISRILQLPLYLNTDFTR